MIPYDKFIIDLNKKYGDLVKFTLLDSKNVNFLVIKLHSFVINGILLNKKSFLRKGICL
jgi:hypothetical protein